MVLYASDEVDQFLTALVYYGPQYKRSSSLYSTGYHWSYLCHSTWVILSLA